MSERYSYILSETDEIYHIRELLKRRLHFSSRLLRQLKKQDCVFLDGTPVWPVSYTHLTLPTKA